VSDFDICILVELCFVEFVSVIPALAGLRLCEFSVKFKFYVECLFRKYLEFCRKISTTDTKLIPVPDAPKFGRRPIVDLVWFAISNPLLASCLFLSV
jgi:hypothetical protein